MQDIDELDEEQGGADDAEMDLDDVEESLREWVTKIDESSYRLRLDFPVMHGEKQVTEIVGRRPCGRHMGDLTFSKTMKTAAFVRLFQNSSGTPSAVTDQMDIGDVMRVVALMGFFMGGGRLTGLT